MYRGLEMAQSARILTNVAQYYEYTRDPLPLLKYLPKIKGVSNLLLARQAIALALPSSDTAHGCLTGNDEADLFGMAIDPRYDTEMAFMSITAEAWRGFRDLGRAMAALGESEYGRELSGNATVLWSTFRRAMDRNIVPAPAPAPPLAPGAATSASAPAPEPASAPAPAPPSAAPCRPYVFGARGNHTCGELPTSSAPSQRDSESWRTYSEAMYSGALLRHEVADILAWHKTNPTSSGSSLKVGALSG